MAVYTQLSSETLSGLLRHYDVGTLLSAKGIAEGVSNSNWIVETSGSDDPGAPDGTRFILTMYERRIDLDDLPFFLGLLDHLSDSGLPVPRTIHGKDGAAWRMLDGKAVALIEFLPGVSVDTPTPTQAQHVGRALAQMHQASLDFDMSRRNHLDPEESARVLAACDRAALAEIDPSLPAIVDEARDIAARWPADLPRAIIHSDLFPDNVLLTGEKVSGFIDFYFACEDAMAYDLAVTHAAWSFADEGRSFSPDVGHALIRGYESVRELSSDERAALPLLAEGACMRFISSRTQDWIDTPADALVTRKDPMDFVRRFETYRENGARLFAA